MQPDLFNHPPHYQTENGLECIDAIQAALGDAAFVDYCRGNVLKYAWRSSLKGAPAADLRKAAWYATRAAQVIEGQK